MVLVDDRSAAPSSPVRDAQVASLPWKATGRSNSSPTKALLVESASQLYRNIVTPSTLSSSQLRLPVGNKHADALPSSGRTGRAAGRRVALLGRELRTLTAAELHSVRTAAAQELCMTASGGPPSRLLRATIGQLERLQNGLVQLEASQVRSSSPIDTQAQLVAMAEASEAAATLSSLLRQTGLSGHAIVDNSAAAGPPDDPRSPSLQPSANASFRGRHSQPAQRLAASASSPSFPASPLRGAAATQSLPTLPAVPAPTPEPENFATLASYQSASHLVFSSAGRSEQGSFAVPVASRPPHSQAEGSGVLWSVLELLNTATSETHLTSLVLGPLTTAIRAGSTELKSHLLLCDKRGSEAVLSPQGSALPPVPAGAGLMGLALSTQRTVSCGVAQNEARYSAAHEEAYFGQGSVVIVPLLPPARHENETTDAAPLGVLVLAAPPHVLSDAASLIYTVQMAASQVSLTLIRLRASAKLHQHCHARSMRSALLAGDTQALQRHVRSPTATGALLDAVRDANLSPPETVATSDDAGDGSTALMLAWAEQLLPVLAAHFGCAHALFLRFDPKLLVLCAGDDPRARGAVRLSLPGAPSSAPGSAAAKLAAAKPGVPAAAVAACTLGAAFTADSVAAPVIGAAGELVGVIQLTGRLVAQIGVSNPQTGSPYSSSEAQQLRAAANALVERVHASEGERAAGEEALETKRLRLLLALLAMDDSSSDGGSALALSVELFCSAVLRCSHAALLQVGEHGAWGWDGLGRLLQVQHYPHSPQGLALAAAQSGEAIASASPQQLAGFGGASDLPALVEASAVEGVVVVPLAPGNGVVQLSRLPTGAVAESAPAASALASASAAAVASAAALLAAKTEYLAARQQAQNGDSTTEIPPPPQAEPPVAPPPTPPRPPLASCQQVLVGAVPTLRAALPRAFRTAPKVSEQLSALQRAVALQLCVARRGAAATAAAAGSPTDEDASQAATSAAIATAVRLLRGLLNATGARLLLRAPTGDMLHSSPRCAVAATQGVADSIVPEDFFLRPITRTQLGIGIAAAYYRKPQRWDRQSSAYAPLNPVTVPQPEPELDGVPGVAEATDLNSVLAVPLLLHGALVGVLVLSNKTTAAATALRPGSPSPHVEDRMAELLSARDATPGARWPTAPWLQAGLREAGWLEEPSTPSKATDGAASQGGGGMQTEFTDTDAHLATTLTADVTLAVVHAQLDEAAASARQQTKSPSTQNVLRERVRCVLSCAPTATLLERRACRVAAMLLQAEQVLLFRFEPSSLTLQRSASSGSAALPSRAMVLDPRAPRGIAGTVALTGFAHATDVPHADPALLPGVDAPDGVELENVMAVPIRAAGGQAVVGVLQAINRRQSIAGGRPDRPMAQAAAREHGVLDLGGQASPNGGEAPVDEAIAMWEWAVLAMLADEIAAALSLVEARENEPADPKAAAKIEQLCAAEQRLAEAEDKVALVRAGMELRQ